MVISDIYTVFDFCCCLIFVVPLLEKYVCCFNTLPQKLSWSCYK